MVPNRVRVSYCCVDASACKPTGTQHAASRELQKQHLARMNNGHIASEQKRNCPCLAVAAHLPCPPGALLHAPLRHPCRRKRRTGARSCRNWRPHGRHRLKKAIQLHGFAVVETKHLASYPGNRNIPQLRSNSMQAGS